MEIPVTVQMLFCKSSRKATYSTHHLRLSKVTVPVTHYAGETLWRQ